MAQVGGVWGAWGGGLELTACVLDQGRTGTLKSGQRGPGRVGGE